MGKVRVELSCTPMLNAETDHVLKLRAIEAQKPKSSIQIMNRLPSEGLMNSNNKQFDNFIKINTEDKPMSKAKKNENKHTRWPENQLMDALTNCFMKFTYWPMKSLRREIPQPEAFIREMLERIAVMHRNGRFANMWALRPDYRNTMAASRNVALPSGDTAAPVNAPGGADADDDDDDDDIKMEDVL